MQYSEISDRINMAMQEQGRSYSWLSRKTGYSEKSLDRWLTGAEEPKAGPLIRILASLGLRLEVLSK